MALVLEDVGNDSDFDLAPESASKPFGSVALSTAYLHGGEAQQEAFDNLITFTSKAKGWSVIAAPPKIGISARVKFAVDAISKQTQEIQLKKALEEQKAESNKMAQEWKAVLLKYNEKLSKQEAAKVAEQTNSAGQVSPIWVDLRGVQSKSEILASFASQLQFAMCGSIDAIQQQLVDFLLTNMEATVLVLDHVAKEACPVLLDMLAPLATKVGCIVVADLNVNSAQVFREGVVGDTDLLCGNLFVEAVTSYAHALSIPWDLESEKENERVLIYSSTLSLRGAKTLASSVMGFVVDDISTPSTPVPRSASGFFEAQVVNEESRGAFTLLLPEKKSITIEKIDLIAELSGGIPGLIQLMGKLEVGVLKKMQTIFKTHNLKTKLRTNKFTSAGRVYSVLAVFYKAVLSSEVLSAPLEELFTVLTLSAPRLMLNAYSPVVLATLVSLDLIKKSGIDETTIKQLISVGVLQELESGYVHVPNMVYHAMISSKSAITAETRQLAQQRMLTLLWTEFKRLLSDNVIIGYVQSQEDVAMIYSVAMAARNISSEIQVVMSHLRALLSVLKHVSTATSSAFIPLSKVDSVKMILGLMSLGRQALLTWLPTDELFALLTAWISQTLLACSDTELLDIISTLSEELSAVGIKGKEFVVVEGMSFLLKVLYSAWWEKLNDETNTQACTIEFIKKIIVLSKKLPAAKEDEVSSVYYSSRLSVLQFEFQYFTQFIATNDPIDKLDHIAIETLLEEYVLVLKRQTNVFLLSLESNESTHGHGIHMDSLTDVEDEDEHFSSSTAAAVRTGATVLPVKEAPKRMEGRMKALRFKLDVEANNLPSPKMIIGTAEIADLMSFAVVNSIAEIYSFAGHWLLRALLRRKYSISGVHLPFSGRLLRSLNLSNFVVMNAEDELRIYEYLQQLVVEEQHLTPRPWQHVLDTVSPVSRTAAEQEIAHLFILQLIQCCTEWHYRAFKELSKFYNPNVSLQVARQGLLYCDSISACRLFEQKNQANKVLATLEGVQDAKSIVDTALTAVSKDLSALSMTDWSQRLMLSELYTLIAEFAFATLPTITSNMSTQLAMQVQRAATAAVMTKQKGFYTGRLLYSTPLRLLYAGHVATEIIMMITSITSKASSHDENEVEDDSQQEVFIPHGKFIDCMKEITIFLHETSQSSFKQDTLILQRLFLVAVDSHGAALDKVSLAQTVSRMVMQQQLTIFAVRALSSLTQHSQAMMMLKQVLNNIRDISDTIYANETADIEAWNHVIDGLFDDLDLLKEREEEAKKVDDEHRENTLAMDASKNDSKTKAPEDEKDAKIDDDDHVAAAEEEDENNEPKVFTLEPSIFSPYSLTMCFADGLYLMSELMYHDSFVRYRLEPGVSKEIALSAFQQYHATVDAALEVYANDLSMKRHCAITLNVLRDLAKRQVAQHDFIAATKTHEDILKLFLTAKFTTMLTLAQCYHEYGEMLMDKKEYFHATLMFQMAVDNYRDFDTSLVTADGVVHERDRLYLPPNLRNWNEEQQKECMAMSVCSKAKACLGNEDWEGAQENAELALHILEEMVVSRGVEGSSIGPSTSLTTNVDDAANTSSAIVPNSSEVTDTVPNTLTDRRTLVVHSTAGIDTYIVLGLIHYHFEELTEAAEYYNKARTALTRLGREESLEMAKVLHNIGILLHSEEKLDEAQSCLATAMQILVKRYSNTAVYQLASTMEALQAIFSEKGNDKEVEIFEKYADDIELRLATQETRRAERIRALERELSGLADLDEEHDHKKGSKKEKNGPGLVDRLRSALFGFLGPVADNGGSVKNSGQVGSGMLLQSPRTGYSSPRPSNVELLVVDDPPIASGPYKLDPTLLSRPPARSARATATSFMRESFDEEEADERGSSFDMGGKISKQKRSSNEALRGLQPLSRNSSLGQDEKIDEEKAAGGTRRRKQQLSQHQTEEEQDELPAGNCVVC